MVRSGGRVWRGLLAVAAALSMALGGSAAAVPAAPVPDRAGPVVPFASEGEAETDALVAPRGRPASRSAGKARPGPLPWGDELFAVHPHPVAGVMVLSSPTAGRDSRPAPPRFLPPSPALLAVLQHFTC
jgi:hypothetical protein